ncbi:hypothetical protein ACF0H5_011930 [Mactra antiquata]
MYCATFITFQILIVLCLILENAQGTFLTDYDTFFHELLEDSDDISASRSKRLQYKDVNHPNTIGHSKVDNSLLTNLGFDLNSLSMDEDKIVPQAFRNNEVRTKTNDDKADRKWLELDNSLSVLSKVLSIIDKLELPNLKSVQGDKTKRNNANDWNNDPIFRRLMQAAYRLGELEEDAPRLQGRRFHAWGG